jgi:hypothetical protein
MGYHSCESENGTVGPSLQVGHVHSMTIKFHYPINFDYMEAT